MRGRGGGEGGQSNDSVMERLLYWYSYFVYWNSFWQNNISSKNQVNINCKIEKFDHLFWKVFIDHSPIKFSEK